MDPSIWSELPFDLLEHIASFCDIDSRRALGFKPRPLPPLTPPPFRPRQVVFRYFTQTRTLLYLEVWGYNDYLWEIKTDMRFDPEFEEWSHGPRSRWHAFFKGKETEGQCISYEDEGFMMAGRPVFV